MGNSDPGGELDYLCVDDFLKDIVGARSLASAFELGLIDHLQQVGFFELGDFKRLNIRDGRGLSLLLGMLQVNGVIERADGMVVLTFRFSQALKYRDLLEAKLQFAAMVLPDFLDLFTLQLVEPERFFSTARVFGLFSYDRCLESTPENYSYTERWVAITTALTKYESAVCLRHHDFSGYFQMLDVGGNSGEFALQICKKIKSIRATIYDLPVVCEVGARHVGGEFEAERISFVKSDGVVGSLPQGQDLVTFKSMLHDWPEEDVQNWLVRAYRALNPGGTVLIFERSILDIGKSPLPYSHIPLMLFFRSYRSQEIYSGKLAAAGFHDIRCEIIELDMPFMLVTARK